MSWVVKATDEAELIAFNKARELLGPEGYVSIQDGKFEVGITDAEGNHPVGQGASWDEAIADATNNMKYVEEIEDVEEGHDINKALSPEYYEVLPKS